MSSVCIGLRRTSGAPFACPGLGSVRARSAGAMRTIRDGEGRAWRVWHVVPQSQVLKASVPGMHGGWLCFESDGDKRRLLPPPAGWDRCTEPELLEMLGQATRVMARTQPS